MEPSRRALSCTRVSSLQHVAGSIPGRETTEEPGQGGGKKGQLLAGSPRSGGNFSLAAFRRRRRDVSDRRAAKFSITPGARSYLVIFIGERPRETPKRRRKVDPDSLRAPSTIVARSPPTLDSLFGGRLQILSRQVLSPKGRLLRKVSRGVSILRDISIRRRN